MRRPPCIVTFSGGRDSSLVLAAAIRVARRDGLPEPVPLTYRFPGVPAADESRWQEHVVARLGVDDWERIAVTDALDCVGADAQRVLRRHGPLFPANVHAHLPALERAGRGSVLTGAGGDDVFSGWRFGRVADALAGRRPPVPRDAVRLGFAVAPDALRRLADRRTVGRLAAPWLRPAARRIVVRELASTLAREPARWPAWLAWRLRQRARQVSLSSLARLADDAGALLLHPLVDPRFVGSLARAGRRLGLGDRTRTLTALFSGVLPADILARTSKALFNDVLMGEPTRRFAETWDGCGVDHDILDAEALRAAWLGEPPDFRGALALQAAWLASADCGEHELDRLGDSAPAAGPPQPPGR